MAALLVIGLLGVVTASVLTHGTPAANPKLVGVVGPDFSISLEDANGNPVTTLIPGTYDIEVRDNSANHNFDLRGPDGTSVNKTSISGSGVVTWTVTLTQGTWTYVCDAHPATMKERFTVGASASTGTTGATATSGTTGAATTTTSTTVTTTTTTRTVIVRRRCVVPRLIGKRLARARRLAVRAGCRMGRVSRAYSRRIRRGRIAAQRPHAGRRVARGTRVNVVVSRGVGG